ncbi:MAG: hypothetical protein IJD02_03240 [Lachnospiraceae bacterium]|nr:hypothetical protein [Lachnospiraceae bacterium]
MRVRLILVIMLLASIMTGCDGDKDKEKETKAPTVTDHVVETQTPDKTPHPNGETLLPGSTVLPEDNTMPPYEPTVTPGEQTQMPDSTADVDKEQADEENTQSKEDEYKYVREYSFGKDVDLVQQNRCEVQVEKRISLLKLSDTRVWVEDNKLYIGYNDDRYGEIIDFVTKKGEISFRYKEEFEVFNKDKIDSITIKKDYLDNEIMVFLLADDYAETFYKFTSEHINGWFILSCDGVDIMQINIDMPVENGEFSVVKVPEKHVLDLFPAYILSGTIIELNPTTI